MVSFRHRPVTAGRLRVGRRAVAAALVLAAATAAHAVNYVPNPGFESCATTPTSWAPFGTDLVACNAAMPHTGAFSMSVGNAAGAGLARAVSTCVAIPPGLFINDFR